MIDMDKFLEAKRLLASKNFSQRKIAAVVGISRATVNAIARGKRDRRELGETGQDTLAPSGPLVRCPGCGGKVQLPCLTCRAERRRQLDELVLRELRRQARRTATASIPRSGAPRYWEREAQRE